MVNSQLKKTYIKMYTCTVNSLCCYAYIRAVSYMKKGSPQLCLHILSWRERNVQGEKKIYIYKLKLKTLGWYVAFDQLNWMEKSLGRENILNKLWFFHKISAWHPTPVLLPRRSHGRRSLEGCSPWGCLELDTTERLHFLFSLSFIGEGNGTPLQCSCLENPRDGGA